jgi:hypothetical protein
MMHLVALKFDSTRNKLKRLMQLNLFISAAQQQMHLLCRLYGMPELPQAEFI